MPPTCCWPRLAWQSITCVAEGLGGRTVLVGDVMTDVLLQVRDAIAAPARCSPGSSNSAPAATTCPRSTAPRTPTTPIGCGRRSSELAELAPAGRPGGAPRGSRPGRRATASPSRGCGRDRRTDGVPAPGHRGPSQRRRGDRLRWTPEGGLPATACRARPSAPRPSGWKPSSWLERARQHAWGGGRRRHQVPTRTDGRRAVRRRRGCDEGRRCAAGTPRAAGLSAYDAGGVRADGTEAHVGEPNLVRALVRRLRSLPESLRSQLARLAGSGVARAGCGHPGDGGAARTRAGRGGGASGGRARRRRCRAVAVVCRAGGPDPGSVLAARRRPLGGAASPRSGDQVGDPLRRHASSARRSRPGTRRPGLLRARGGR